MEQELFDDEQLLNEIKITNGEIQDRSCLPYYFHGPWCAPGLFYKYCSAKIEEMMMSVLWQMDRKDPHRAAAEFRKKILGK